ncbi:MAG: ribbon-helix-helix protein, CopG family [Patescibacteria group bacterium]|jgi:Ribbon-helix-helix protein, copG family.|nr:ribbon-helix-helix protein, CopG family [Patescibacteria group bacterium]
MTTLSISLDEKLKKEIDRFSKEDGVSKSVVVRRLLEQATWERTWKEMSIQIRKKLDKLNLSSVDEIEKFLG